MTDVHSGKQRGSSGLKAWRLKWPKHIVVFDPSVQGSGLEGGRVRLWNVHERNFQWCERIIRERLESLSPELRARSIKRYVDWKNTQEMTIEDSIHEGTIGYSVPVYCYKCRTEWMKGTAGRCNECRWERCPSCDACGCGYDGAHGN